MVRRLLQRVPLRLASLRFLRTTSRGLLSDNVGFSDRRKTPRLDDRTFESQSTQRNASLE